MSDHDDTIDIEEARALSRALRDVPSPSPELAQRHLDAALAAYDDQIASSNVVSLSSRRQRVQLRFAAVAAALLVVGGLAGWVSRGTRDSDQRSPGETVVRNAVRPCTNYEGDYLGDVEVQGISYALFLKRASTTLDVVLLDPVTCAVPTTQP